MEGGGGAHSWEQHRAVKPLAWVEAPNPSWLELLWSSKLSLCSYAGQTPIVCSWPLPPSWFCRRDWQWSNTTSRTKEMIQCKSSPAGFFWRYMFGGLARLIPASDSPDCTDTQVGALCICTWMHWKCGTEAGRSGKSCWIVAGWCTPIPSPI